MRSVHAGNNLVGCCPVDVCVVVHFAVYIGKLTLGVVRGDVCACHTAKHGDKHAAGHALVRGEGGCGRAVEQRLIGHIFDGILCPVARDVGEGAWVTHGGNDKLEERLCVRPTSETLFCEHYAKIVRSWRDLPKLYNQWCSVVRWEKTTRPFLRSREFWWQEGHTVHATAEEAMEETLRMLNIYAKFFEEWLAIPVVKGEKTEKERFAGAENTYTIEAMMHDCKALQSGTSHYFGDGFARAFGMQYTDKNNTLQYMYQTSWGVSTRIIGAIIMTHGDNEGLVLPPRIAPTQLVVIPVAAHKEGVKEKATELYEQVKAAGIRAKIDLSDNTPGWKFAEYEMKGIPLRLEVGPRDIAEGQCVLVRRDTREKTVVKFEDLEKTIPALLEDIQKSLYEKALANREAHTYTAKSLDEMKSILAEHTGFIKSMWCGDLACEEKVKEETGMPSRCMPFEQEHIADTCPVCGKPANKMVVWGIAY